MEPETILLRPARARQAKGEKKGKLLWKTKTNSSCCGTAGRSPDFEPKYCTDFCEQGATSTAVIRFRVQQLQFARASVVDLSCQPPCLPQQCSLILRGCKHHHLHTLPMLRLDNMPHQRSKIEMRTMQTRMHHPPTARKCREDKAPRRDMTANPFPPNRHPTHPHRRPPTSHQTRRPCHPHSLVVAVVPLLLINMMDRRYPLLGRLLNSLPYQPWRPLPQPRLTQGWRRPGNQDRMRMILDSMKGEVMATTTPASLHHETLTPRWQLLAAGERAYRHPAPQALPVRKMRAPVPVVWVRLDRMAG